MQRTTADVSWTLLIIMRLKTDWGPNIGAKGSELFSGEGYPTCSNFCQETFAPALIGSGSSRKVQILFLCPAIESKNA